MLDIHPPELNADPSVFWLSFPKGICVCSYFSRFLFHLQSPLSARSFTNQPS